MLYEERQKWLDSLEVGTLIAASFGYNRRWYYGRITKISKTRQITVKIGEHEYVFRKNGQIWPKDRYSGVTEINPLTNDMVNDRRRSDYIHEIKKFDFSKLTLEQADEVLNLIEKFKSKIVVDESNQS